MYIHGLGCIYISPDTATFDDAKTLCPVGHKFFTPTSMDQFELLGLHMKQKSGEDDYPDYIVILCKIVNKSIYIVQ